MERIDEHTVEMTPEEKKAEDSFDGLLDEGLSILEAAKRTEEQYPGLDPSFYAWLRDEAVGFTPILSPEELDKLFEEHGITPKS